MIKAIAILLFGAFAINAQHYAYGRRGGIIGGRKGIIGGGHGGKIIGGYGHHGSTWGQNHGGFVSERRIDSGVVGGGVIGGGVIGGGAVGGGIIGGGAVGGGIVEGGVIGGGVLGSSVIRDTHISKRILYYTFRQILGHFPLQNSCKLFQVYPIIVNI